MTFRRDLMTLLPAQPRSVSSPARELGLPRRARCPQRKESRIIEAQILVECQ